ncbi:MAG: hypothetical protein U0174_12945 [Polyangiaceae bacterium]
MRKARLLSVLAFAAGFWPAASRAAPTARLVYMRGEGAEACVDEEGLTNAVAKRLGRDPFRPIAESTIAVTVRREESRFVARLTMADRQGKERGERILKSKGDDCADLTDTLALTISIALDPLVLVRPPPKDESPSDPASVPPIPLSPDPPPPPMAPPPPVSPPRSRFSFGIGTGGHVSFLAAPAVAAGPDLWANVYYRYIGAELSTRIDAPAGRSTSEGGTVSAAITGATFGPCARASILAFCVPLTMASLAVSSRDITSPRSDTQLWFALGGRLSVAIPVTTALRVRVFGEVAAPLAPYELRVNGRVVYTSDPVALSLGAGPSFSFE